LKPNYFDLYQGWWNGLGRAGVPAGFILGEQVAVGSLYYFNQSSVSFSQPGMFSISANQKCFAKSVAVRFVQVM